MSAPVAFSHTTPVTRQLKPVQQQLNFKEEDALSASYLGQTSDFATEKFKKKLTSLLSIEPAKFDAKKLDVSAAMEASFKMDAAESLATFLVKMNVKSLTIFLLKMDVKPLTEALLKIYAKALKEALLKEDVDSLVGLLLKEDAESMKNLLLKIDYSIWKSLPPPPLDKIFIKEPPHRFEPILYESMTLKLNDIPEDSIYRKLLACIPLAGSVVSTASERSLGRKITQTKDSVLLQKLIQVKNHYKISSVIRDLLTVALIISKVVSAIFIAAVVLAGAYSILFHTYEIYKNRQLVEQLKEKGFPESGITVR